MTPRIEAIEAEYGEPIYDVVAGFAAGGESRRSTGEILGYHPQYFSQRVLPKIDPDGTIQWPEKSARYMDAIRSPELRKWRSQLTKEQWRAKTQVCINGEWRSRAEWRAYYGISQDAVRQRMRRYGWSFEKAVSTPLIPRGKRREEGVAA